MCLSFSTGKVGYKKKINTLVWKPFQVSQGVYFFLSWFSPSGDCLPAEVSYSITLFTLLHPMRISCFSCHNGPQDTRSKSHWSQWKPDLIDFCELCIRLIVSKFLHSSFRIPSHFTYLNETPFLFCMVLLDDTSSPKKSSVNCNHLYYFLNQSLSISYTSLNKHCFHLPCPSICIWVLMVSPLILGIIIVAVS